MKPKRLVICNYEHKEDCVEDCYHRFPHEPCEGCKQKCDISSLVKCVTYHAPEGEVSFIKETDFQLMPTKKTGGRMSEPKTCRSCGAILDEVEARYGYCHPCLNEAALEAGGD